MKKFLYGRLKDADKDYGFYIPPQHSVGKLGAAIASDLISSKTKLLFLQSRDGNITFGVRERLTLRDDFGRLRCNFTGYQPEPGEGAEAVPVFSALQAQFSAITQEAHEAHARLDEDSQCGKMLQDTYIRFAPAVPQGGNDWDRAVREMRRDPFRSVLLMFDERGAVMPLPGADRAEDILFIREEQAGGASAPMPDDISMQPDSNATPGIASTARLEETDRTIVPPLPPMPPRPARTERGFLGLDWRAINPLSWRTPSSPPRKTKDRKGGYLPPEP